MLETSAKIILHDVQRILPYQFSVDVLHCFTFAYDTNIAQHSSYVTSILSVHSQLSKADTWSWFLPYFSHLLHLPPRQTPL